MQLNFFEFYFFSISASFIEELDTITFKYQVKSILATLVKYFRDLVFK